MFTTRLDRERIKQPKNSGGEPGGVGKSPPGRSYPRFINKIREKSVNEGLHIIRVDVGTLK